MLRLISFLVSFTAVVLSGCGEHHHEGAEATSYIVTRPVALDTTMYREYVCQIHSVNHIELRSQERGYLQGIYVDEGQFVRKGELLFQIMPVIYQAEMLKAKANVEFAEIEYYNTKSLADSNIVSAKELALAKARLDRERAELALAEAHLAFTEIRAPFDGIIDRFHERVGSLVEEGTLLTTLSDNSKMWVYFNVPEAEYLDYKTGRGWADTSAVLLKMANNQMFSNPGVIETIEAEFNHETGNIAFRATFSNPEGLLRNGETGNIMMPVPLKGAILIPQKATYEILDKRYVFVINQDNTVESRLITTAAEMPHLYVVGSGLSEQDQILVEGLRKVKNGQSIVPNYREFREVLDGLHEMHAE